MNSIKALLALVFFTTLTTNTFAQNVATKKSNSLLESSDSVDQWDKKRMEVYNSLKETYGKETADRLIRGKLEWGDDELAVLLAHWYEQGVTIGHENVSTPLGKAKEWHFGISNITCYFINDRLIGIVYPSKHPSWLPKGYNFSNHVKVEEITSLYDHLDLNSDSLRTSISSYIPSMNDEVRGYYEKAIKGDPLAQFQLGACLSDGDGVDEGGKEAVYWYKKSAEGGNAWGQFNLGIEYSNGEYITCNYANALYWFKKAALQGDHDAQYQVASLYYDSENVGRLKKDYAKALFWFKKATASKDKDVKACSYYFLSQCYKLGRGTKKNIALANKYFKTAKAFGYTKGLEKEF